jgi:L-threonylcarbamoyladenylate synthase
MGADRLEEAGLDAAVAAVRRGAVIAIPTDTVYGLACDPRDDRAVDRVFAIKRRPAALELTLLAAALEDLEELVTFTPAGRLLATRFWPGALSIVLPVGARRLGVPRSGGTLAARVPLHPLARAILRRTGPLASTSANHHGEAAAKTAAEVRRALGDDVALVLEGGPAAGQPSTIIDCTSTPPRVLRDGPISRAMLAHALEEPANSEAP